MCTALIVGNMIGSGIYLLPATLAPYGWNAIYAWMLTISGGICLAYIFSCLSRRYPDAGGPYLYTEKAFGKAPGFMVAWSYWISMWVGNAAIATGTVSYLSVFLPQLVSVSGLAPIVTLALIWSLTAVNCRGAYLAGSVQLITTLLKLLPLLAVIGIAMLVLGAQPEVRAGIPVMEFTNANVAAITAAATLTLWGLLGLESATVPADKVENPSQTIPRATMFGMLFTGIIYLLACSAIILMLPADQVSNSNAPFADFMQTYVGNGASSVLVLFAAISGFGALNGWVMLQGELPSAMARHGVFPAWLGVTSSRGTPVRAHIVASVLLTVVVLMNYSRSMTELFEFVVLLSTTASLFMFLVCSMAALKLQLNGELQASPVVLVIALLALVFAIWTIIGAGGEAVMWGLVLLAAGIPVYLWVRKAQH